MALQMSWDEIIRGTLTQYVNHGLTALALYLGQHGLRADSVLTPENILVLAAALVTGGISLTMSLYRSKANHNIITAARNTEPGTPFATIEREAAKLPIVGKEIAA